MTTLNVQEFKSLGKLWKYVWIACVPTAKPFVIVLPRLYKQVLGEPFSILYYDNVKDLIMYYKTNLEILSESIPFGHCIDIDSQLGKVSSLTQKSKDIFLTNLKAIKAVLENDDVNSKCSQKKIHHSLLSENEKQVMQRFQISPQGHIASKELYHYHQKISKFIASKV